jgi:phage FluMu gp28-like protein
MDGAHFHPKGYQLKKTNIRALSGHDTASFWTGVPEIEDGILKTGTPAVLPSGDRFPVIASHNPYPLRFRFMIKADRSGVGSWAMMTIVVLGGT